MSTTPTRSIMDIEIPELGVVPHAEPDIISMPDKWEYPWYAAWDLAFHTLPLSIVTLTSQQQMELMLRAATAPQRPDARVRVELQ